MSNKHLKNSQQPSTPEKLRSKPLEIPLDYDLMTNATLKMYIILLQCRVIRVSVARSISSVRIGEYIQYENGFKSNDRKIHIYITQ
jgi:hypothetical protein